MIFHTVDGIYPKRPDGGAETLSEIFPAGAKDKSPKL